MNWELLGVTVSVLGIAGSVFGFLAARVSSYLAVQREIAGLYDRMVECRLSRPNVMECAWQWTRDLWAKVYDQSGTDGSKWADYYSYIELCLAFCNAVLENRSRLIGWIAFGGGATRRERLVKLIVTEHWPIFADMARIETDPCCACQPTGNVRRGRVVLRRAEDPKFLSPVIVRYMTTMARNGWDWQAEHCKLVWGETNEPRCSIQSRTSSAAR